MVSRSKPQYHFARVVARCVVLDIYCVETSNIDSFTFGLTRHTIGLRKIAVKHIIAGLDYTRSDLLIWCAKPGPMGS